MPFFPAETERQGPSAKVELSAKPKIQARPGGEQAAQSPSFDRGLLRQIGERAARRFKEDEGRRVSIESQSVGEDQAAATVCEAACVKVEPSGEPEGVTQAEYDVLRGLDEQADSMHAALRQAKAEADDVEMWELATYQLADEDREVFAPICIHSSGSSDSEA